jgi:hypothetical protein
MTSPYLDIPLFPLADALKAGVKALCDFRSRPDADRAAPAVTRRSQKPISDAQFEAKFRDCARNAPRPLSDESVDAVLSRVRQLDRVADVRELLAPFEE